jgi:hypothetical protein
MSNGKSLFRAVTAITLVLASIMSMNAFAQVKSAKIYFVPWETEFRVAQRASDIRKHPDKTREIFDEHLAESLVNLLREGSWTGSSMIKDVRLVIDITYQDGTQESYIANRFEIFSARSARTRNNDAHFRSRLSSFLEQ